jgi:Flp pilus assembly CpaE family ATPase
MSHWSESSNIQLLCSKLKQLKKAVILWQREKKAQLQSDLLLIESRMADLFDKNPSQVFQQDDLDLLKVLKQEKDKILAVEEDTWRLRSRAIWLSSGDKNTKFFHKYATMRRSQNTIWDIEDESGILHSSESEIK